MECTRQFAYSTQNHNTIDMVLSVNGIPVVALELKNQLTGQNVENSRHQWMNDRDFHEELFQFNHRILAYFGVDLYEAIMATHLMGEKTFFMPFISLSTSMYTWASGVARTRTFTFSSDP